MARLSCSAPRLAALAGLMLLAACAGTDATPSAPTASATAGAPSLTPQATASPTATAAPEVAVVLLSARPFHEPGDHAHRNYCGAGATEVLLSVWEADVPGLETVARAAHLDPTSGQTGADTAAAINGFLAPVVRPALGADRYSGAHVARITDLYAWLRRDLLDRDATRLFGHAVPVMVQTMTRTMPGWYRWNATHMITIVGIDLRHDDAAVDVVTYAETPSAPDGYRGPDFQTITVRALWTAMQQFLTDSPRDPINLIG